MTNNDSCRSPLCFLAILCVLFFFSFRIGGQVLAALRQSRPQDHVLLASARADDEVGVEDELLSLRPDRVVSLIGRTHGAGFSTIDYLEQKGKLQENVRDNLYAPLCLMYLSAKHGIHYTYLYEHTHTTQHAQAAAT